METRPLSLRQLPASKFVRDYADNFAGLRGWFHYDPHDSGCFAARFAELDTSMQAYRSSVDRGALAAAVLEQQQRWGAGNLALEAAASLANDSTFAVVTGQQVGLYGGPLYTQLKALAVIKLARKLAAQFPGKRFVPMFWMASGDSDFEEVRRTYTLDRAGELVELALPAQDNTDNRSMRVRDVAAELAALNSTLSERLPGGEFRDEVLATLTDCYSSGTLVDGFARWMLKLFAGMELVVIDPQEAVLAAAARPLLRHQLEHAPELDDIFEARTAELRAAGYAPQADHAPGDTSLFLLDEGGSRQKIIAHGRGFVLGPGGTAITREELLGVAAAAPERFVCGVLTRPIYQNLLFPLAAWVGGAAEISYRAQVTTLFELHGQRMAPALLRSMATLLPRRSAELLDELGWQLPDCLVAPQELAARAAQGSLPVEIDAALQRYRQLLDSADLELQRLAIALDPTLEQSFATLRGNLDGHVDRLEKKITSVLKQRDESLQRRVAALSRLVYPQQGLQERVLGLLSFLPRYGFELIPQLLEALPVPTWEHNVAILD